MKAKFTQSFKIQAVKKALNRSNGTTVKKIADELGIGQSTLGKWIIKSRNNELEKTSIINVTKEKRPQDFNLEERMDLIISCSSLNESEVSQLCRKKGIFSHHIKQWTENFTQGQITNMNSNNSNENKQLKAENKALKKEINRKDKALAETAALLVLQKKVQEIWGSNEVNLQ